jgi:tetratricopeptide (TPR) repeat protein
MKRNAGKLIKRELDAERWDGARRLIVSELKRTPKDHWLMTRLAVTFYEQRKYDQALHWDIAALQEAPYCPLAIWGYACDLEMLGRYQEALAVFRWLASWDEDHLANGECGEGIRKARSLVADCLYRIACIWEAKRQWTKSAAAFQGYLSRRANGSSSIYRLRDVKAEYNDVLSHIRG